MEQYPNGQGYQKLPPFTGTPVIPTAPYSLLQCFLKERKVLQAGCDPHSSTEQLWWLKALPAHTHTYRELPASAPQPAAHSRRDTPGHSSHPGQSWCSAATSHLMGLSQHTPVSLGARSGHLRFFLTHFKLALKLLAEVA